MLIRKLLLLVLRGVGLSRRLLFLSEAVCGAEHSHSSSIGALVLIHDARDVQVRLTIDGDTQLLVQELVKGRLVLAVLVGSRLLSHQRLLLVLLQDVIVRCRT